MSKLRILVVDDDHDFAESMAEVLQLDGHQVDCAYSGEEAIAEFTDADYDLAFMDVKLPGRNGVESFLEIRKFRPGAQVFMMTGFTVEQLLEEAVANGARGVLHKPLDMERVLEMINKIRPEGILIADDDPDFVEGIQEVLEDEGYRVFTAHDGREAVDRILCDGIDVLILDVRLPLLSGLEVYLELKRLGHCVPTIIVTGYANEEGAAIDKLRELEVTGILVKPFDPEDLLVALERLAKQSHD